MHKERIKKAKEYIKSLEETERRKRPSQDRRSSSGRRKANNNNYVRKVNKDGTIDTTHIVKTWKIINESKDFQEKEMIKD